MRMTLCNTGNMIKAELQEIKGRTCEKNELPQEQLRNTAKTFDTEHDNRNKSEWQLKPTNTETSPPHILVLHNIEGLQHAYVPPASSSSLSQRLSAFNP